MRYLNTTRETDGNKEVIFAIGSGDNYGIYSQIPHGVTTYNGSPVGGWGGIAVFLNSVERFYTKNGKLPQYDHTFPDKSDWFESAGLSNPDIIKLNVNREPRFYAWVCYDGGEYSSFIADGSPLILEARNSQNMGTTLTDIIEIIMQPDISPKREYNQTSNGALKIMAIIMLILHWQSYVWRNYTSIWRNVMLH